MFQLWKLVLLCGLLAGTSASLLDNRGNDVLRKLRSALESGLASVDSTIEIVNRLTGVRISNVQVPGITFEATSDNSADVKIPITADVTVNLPLLGEIVSLNLTVDLQTNVSIETDAESGDSNVVVGECTNNPESISLTVLHRRFGLFNDVVDFGINLARRVVSSVVQDELCPRIRELLESLGAECVKKLIGEPQDSQQGD
ncbi:hypothetical protein Celaphus_00007886 [Cervus elaphus hippelaphus]|uniref:Lipid-binding serum glycoprotein N-terminal domain-containing protein n=1 Tax=Cervus elaphus hippelaphus TaxID=46360 RepID=A0A212CCG7_CEREH|nr:hypothetical protein Celaphus_00007886 [Cervus elaphus hippelaphus]